MAKLIIAITFVFLTVGSLWFAYNFYRLQEKKDFVSCIQDAGNGRSTYMICETNYPTLFQEWWAKYFPSLK